MFFRHFQHNYGCCCRDVNRGVVVSVRGMSAKPTLELGLRLAICLVAMVALGAGAAGVARIHGDNGYAVELPLVLDEGPQLKETPTAHLRSLTLAKPCPPANAFEVFNGDAAMSAFAEVNESLADNVVLVTTESGFLIADSLHRPPRILAGSSLVFVRHLLAEVAASIQVATADSLNSTALNRIPVTGADDLRDTEINANESLDFNRRILGKINRANQVELAATMHQIALPLESIESRPLIFAEHNGDNLPSTKSQQANAIQPLEAHQPVVVGDCAGWLENRTRILVLTESFTRLSNGAGSHLGRQSELLSNREVARMMQARGAVLLNRESNLGGEAGSGIELPNRVQQQNLLVFGWEKLNLKC